MGLVYIEYISRLPGIDLETFRAQAAQGQEGWDSGYEDELVLSVGRTWRLGPDPGYMTVWHTRNAGLDRIDAWDRIFRSGEADALEQPFFQVARINVAGCYDPLLEPVPARNGTYYAEFFAAHDTADAVRSFYQSRAKQHPEFTLNLLVQRIGKLAPEPGGLAVWTIPDFAALDSVATELDGVNAPIRLFAAGTYADFGREIL
ncbi:MAG: hypothetical protein OXH63_00055 [Gemmatimonadetes bacterium]|nr:hypothetical protein [Gemmatimonadota bacterium]